MGHDEVAEAIETHEEMVRLGFMELDGMIEVEDS